MIVKSGAKLNRRFDNFHWASPLVVYSPSENFFAAFGKMIPNPGKCIMLAPCKELRGLSARIEIISFVVAADDNGHCYCATLPWFFPMREPKQIAD